MAASGDSSGARDWTIVLRNIGKIDEDDLRAIYKCFDSGKEVIERVFTLIGEDSAVVIFTHAKFAEKALHLDHGDIAVSRLPIQIFSSVTAVVDHSVTEMFRSKKLWKEYSSVLKHKYGVAIRKQQKGSDIEIAGGNLEVEQCKIFLEKIYKEHAPKEQQGATGDGKYTKGQRGAGTAERDKTGKEMSGDTRQSMNERQTRGHARTTEGDVNENHGNRCLAENLHGNPVSPPGGFADDDTITRGCHDTVHKVQPGRPDQRRGSKMSTDSATSDVRKPASRASAKHHDEDVEMPSGSNGGHGEPLLPNNSTFGEEQSMLVRGDSSQSDDTPVKKSYLIASTSVHIYAGDITQLQVDVIVNPTNHFLQSGSRLAQAIETVAGTQLTQACRSTIERSGPVPVGLGVSTTAGNLPCKSVFHVVRPTVTYSGVRNFLTDLYCAFTKSLEASEGHCSIAIPAICSDVAGLPKACVSRVFHKAVTDFCLRQVPTSVVDIHLVDTDREAVKLIWQQFDLSLQEAMSAANTAKSGQMSSSIITKSDRDVTSRAVSGLSSKVDSIGSEESGDSTVSPSDGGHGMPGMPYLSCGNYTYWGRRQANDGGTSQSKDENRGNGDKLKHGGASGFVVKLPSLPMGHGTGGSRKPVEMNDTPLGTGDVSAGRRDGRASSGVLTHPLLARSGSSSSSHLASAPSASMNRSLSSNEKGQHASDIPGKDDNKDCPICLEPFVQPITLPNCKHMFCTSCLKSSFEVKQECPICRTGYGKIYGTQPLNATMSVTYEKFSLPGYDSCGTIVIYYDIPDGIQKAEHPHPGVPYEGTRRCGMLPNNREGIKVLRLLRKAFDQRLTFTVGRSMTTGKDNCVTWNDIHHKTSVDGGPTKFGYPDADYLDRVTADLAAKGIK